MARFTALDAPALLPGCCFICRSANKRMFVDTGVTVKWEGVVYVCEDCLREMATLLPTQEGVFTREQVQSAQARAFNLGRAQGIEFAKQIAKAVEEFERGNASDVLSLSTPVSAPGFEPLAVDEPEGVSQDAGEPEGSSVSADSLVVEDGEPVSVEGRDGLSGDSGDGQLELDFGAVEPVRAYRPDEFVPL